MRQPPLFKTPGGPWSGAWLPPLFNQMLTDPLLRALLSAAYRLEEELEWPTNLSSPSTFADAVARYSLVLAVENWAPRVGLRTSVDALQAMLRIEHHSVATLWSLHSLDSIQDDAILAARDMACLAPSRWTLCAKDWGPVATFERLRVARRDEMLPGQKLRIWRLRDPFLGACAPASAAVANARRALRIAPDWLTVGGNRHRMLLRLETLLEGRTQLVDLAWQPVRGSAPRKTRLLVTGVVLDSDGSMRLLLVWHAAVLAVPLPWVIGVSNGRSVG